MTDRLAQLSAAGVAIWLDDLSRQRLASGGLDKLRRESDVVGVTTNPTTFAKALSGADAYADQFKDLSKIGSVASFFVSRVDTEVDKRLDKIGTPEAQALHGKAAIANARLAYQRYEEVFGSDRWQALANAGAHPQRPLWASTSTKNPEYRDVMY